MYVMQANQRPHPILEELWNSGTLVLWWACEVGPNWDSNLGICIHAEHSLDMTPLGGFLHLGQS